MTKRLITVCWLVLLVLTSTPATSPQAPRPISSDEPELLLDYNYHRASWEYELAILDDLAVRAQVLPSPTPLVIVAFAGDTDLPGKALRRARTWANYLVDRRIDRKLIRIQAGPLRDGLRLQVWSNPTGKPLDPSLQLDRPIGDVTQPLKYDQFAYVLPSRLETDDSLGESFYQNMEACLTGFADVLREHPEFTGWLVLHPQRIGHLGGLHDTRKSALKILTVQLAYLRADLHVPESSARGRLGSFSEWRFVELWIVPKGMTLPNRATLAKMAS